MILRESYMFKMQFFIAIMTIVLTVGVSHSAYGQEITDNRQFSYEFDDVPSWVDSSSLSARQQDSRLAINYLRYEEQVNWTQTDLQVYRKLAYEINLEQGLKEGAEFSMSFNPDYQTLKIHSLDIIRNGKTIDVKQKADIRLIQAEQELANKMLTGTVTALVVLGDVRVNDVVEYSYSVIGNNPVFGEKHFHSIGTSWGVPIGEVNFRLITNKNSYLNYQAAGTDIPIKKKNHGNQSIYSWHAKDIEAIRNEDQYPAWFIPNGYIEFSEYRTWEEVNQWAMSLYETPEPLSAELVRMNDEWFSKAESKEEYVEKVVQFVQNDIRYFGMELGLNTHKPYQPSLVFERRYGDCKDKALLMSRLLGEKDVYSRSALVSTELQKGIGTRLPSPGVFNHVINQVIIGGAEYWIDGTQTHQYGKLNTFDSGDYGLALPVSKKTEKLVDVSLSRQAPHQSWLTESLVISGVEEPVKMSFKLYYEGAFAEGARESLDSVGLEEYKTNILNYFRQLYPTIVWSSELQHSDDRENNTFAFYGDLNIVNYWTNPKESLLTVSLYGENINSFVSLPSVLDREYPLAISYPIKIKHDVSVTFHKEIDWQLENGNIDTKDNVMHYSRRVSSKPTQIDVSHSFETISNEVKVADMEHYLSDLRSIRDSLFLSVNFDNSEYNTQTNEREIKNKMRSLLKL